MYDVLQSSASYPLIFGMYDSAGNAVTGLSPTVLLSKNGAATASPAGAVSEIGSGLYKVAGNATDTNTLGPLVLYATGTGAIPALNAYPVVSFNPQSATAFITGVNSLAPPANWNLLSIDGSGRMIVASIANGAIAAATFAANALDAVWSTATRTLTAFSFTVSANVTQLLGTAWLTPGVAGTPDVNAKQLGGTAQTGRDVGASVLLSSGSGTGQLDFTSGVVKSNLAQILGTALTETAGLLAGGFKKFFNIATPAATMDRGILMDTVTTYTGNTVQTGDSFARLGAPAGASISADIAEVEAETDGIASIPTNPLLTTDTRLNNLDATISSRTKPADTQARVTLVDTLTTYTGDTPQTGDAFARLGAPAGASVSADILEANNDLDELITTVGVAGAGLTAIPDSSAVTEIGADVDELIATVGVAGAGLTSIPDSATLTEVGADVDELIVSVGLIPTTSVLTSHFDTIIGNPVVSVSADIAEIEAETDDIASVKAKTDQLTFTVPNQVDANSLTGGLSAAGVRSAIGMASANLDNQLSEIEGETDGIATLQTEVTEMHGLLGQYSGLRDAVYSGSNLTSYNLFLYSSSVNAALNDGVTGVSHQYAVTNTYSGANLLTSTMVRVS